jgi:hypothetical protein
MVEHQVFHVQREGPLWAIKIQAGAALSQHETKRSAVDEGRRTARENQPSRLVIHYSDGSIESEATYEGQPTAPSG